MIECLDVISSKPTTSQYWEALSFTSRQIDNDGMSMVQESTATSIHGLQVFIALKLRICQYAHRRHCLNTDLRL